MSERASPAFLMWESGIDGLWPNFHKLSNFLKKVVKTGEKHIIYGTFWVKSQLFPKKICKISEKILKNHEIL